MQRLHHASPQHNGTMSCHVMVLEIFFSPGHQAWLRTRGGLVHLHPDLGDLHGSCDDDLACTWPKKKETKLIAEHDTMA